MGFPVFMFLHDITDKAPLPFLSGSFSFCCCFHRIYHPENPVY